MSIYLASSWRNVHYPTVLAALRAAGHLVYDFRNPSSPESLAALGDLAPVNDESRGFKWSYIDENYMDWTPEQYREMLNNHPLAVRQFENDERAIRACNTCVLVLPCGRSAHTEAGWFAGNGKKTIVLIPEKQEPELMYKLFDGIACSNEELISMLRIDLK